jgi:RNA polymerase primary sigma factor
MDDEKSITEKLTNALGRATDSVKSTIGSLVDTASNVAQRTMQSNAEKISGQPVAELDSEGIAETSNKQVQFPPVTAVAVPVPLAVPQPAPKSAKKPVTKPAPKKSQKKSARKTKKRAAKATAKKTARKSAKKGSKSKR